MAEPDRFSSERDLTASRGKHSLSDTVSDRGVSCDELVFELADNSRLLSFTAFASLIWDRF